MLYIKLVSLLYNFLEVWQVTGKIQTYISTSPASKNTWISEVDPHTHTHTHTHIPSHQEQLMPQHVNPRAKKPHSHFMLHPFQHPHFLLSHTYKQTHTHRDMHKQNLNRHRALSGCTQQNMDTTSAYL